MVRDHRLDGRRILIVEDEYFQAFDYCDELLARGAEIIGPIASLDEAIDRVRLEASIDGAIVDLSLDGEFVYPLVDELVKRDIPVLFATAHAPDVVPYRFRHITRCEKPIQVLKLASALGTLLVRAA